MDAPATAPTNGGFAAARRELRAVARLAAPVVTVQLGLMLMGVVDTVMLGRVSPAALAACALGHVYSMTFLVAAQGMLMALDPLVAQAFGAGDLAAVRRHFARGTVLAVALSLPLGLVMWDARPVLAALHQQPALLDGVGAYVRNVALGNLPYLLFVVVRQTLQATSQVRPAVIAVIVANLVNLIANWALIFGRLGLPRLELTGAAYATAISRWVLLATLLVAGWRASAVLWDRIRREDLRPSAQVQLLRLGVPIASQVALEMLVFVTVGLVIGSLGVRELAAHQIALNLASLTFMVPLGVAGAAATRVGNAIGRGDMAGARRSAATSLGVGVAVMAVFALVFGFGSRTLAAIYTPDAGVQEMAVALIAIAAVFQVFDGLQVVSLGILRGSADTRVPALVALVGYWLLGLPLGAGLALGAGLGPVGLWWGLTAGLATVAAMLLLRLRRRFRSTVLRIDAAAAAG